MKPQKIAGKKGSFPLAKSLLLKLFGLTKPTENAKTNGSGHGFFCLQKMFISCKGVPFLCGLSHPFWFKQGKVQGHAEVFN